jgi:AhpD family alkylhydroperoxidase
MSILQASGPDPTGAAALLGYADPDELDRFIALEDAVWGATSLAPAVTEAVRLHCARIRGCAFCAAVRVSAAVEDGLSEAQIAKLDDPRARDVFSAEQAAALTLVEHFLRDPRKPDDRRAGEISALLGTAGVMEVLLACVAFASADLRIALGENREPSGSGLVERARGVRADKPASTSWPVLSKPVLDPDAHIPAVAAAVAGPLRQRVAALWSGRDMPVEQVAACIVRSAQLLDISSTDPVYALLVPTRASALAGFDEVRDWPAWSPDKGRNELALAEQIWIDPSGVDVSLTDPLRERLGVAGIIRVAWSQILIGQLHRLTLVLHHEIAAA